MTGHILLTVTAHFDWHAPEAWLMNEVHLGNSFPRGKYEGSHRAEAGVTALQGTFYDSHARAKAKSTGRITKKVE